MLKKLNRKHNEVQHLLSIYEEHKDSPDLNTRRRAHVMVDRWLMENRETALLCVERVLAKELAKARASKQQLVKPPWYKGLLRRTKGGAGNVKPTTTRDA